MSRLRPVGVLPLELSLMVTIQTAGKKRSRHVNGPLVPKNAVTLDASKLKNPFQHLGRSKSTDQETLQKVEEFLMSNDSTRLSKLVQIGVKSIEAGKDVVVVCQFGKHRSRAVAQLIAEKFPPGFVKFLHREN